MIDKMEAGRFLPDNGRVLFTCKDGKVSAVRKLYDDEHISSLNSLIELAEMAGYMIVKKGESEV